MAMTFYQELDDLRARVAALEAKYETMRLATLEWGKDVESLQRWSDQHLLRIERLETGATCPHIVSSDEGTSYCDLSLQTQDKLDRLIAQDRDDITPPPELVQQWVAEIRHEGTPVRVSLSGEHLASRAAQWGADRELEACIHWLITGPYGASIACNADHMIGDLRAARRPKPQTLNSIAMQMLGTIERDGHYIPEITDTIRLALEALPDD